MTKGKAAGLLALLALSVPPFPCAHAAAQSRAALRGAFAGRAASSAEAFDAVTANAWKAGSRFDRLSDIGRGAGVVYSPDLSAPTNRRFYERLGFAYFEDASWRRVLEQIERHNLAHPESRIDTLIVESHGTNGNGLKLQSSSDPRAGRSYISIGALREHLGAAGVRLCVIAACNAGRLFRPRIYHRLDTRTRDPLFLPPTLGVVNSSPRVDPESDRVRVVYPLTSRLETTNEGDTSEFSPAARRLIESFDARAGDAAHPGATGGIKFIVSDTLMQMLLRDPRLRLVGGAYVTRRSRANYTDDESEEMFRRFLSFVEEVAARERQGG